MVTVEGAQARLLRVHVLERGPAAVQPHQDRRSRLPWVHGTSLSEVTLPSNLNEIGKCAFSGCASLGEITLPPNLNEVGRGAFSQCTSLSEITLLPSLNEIGKYIFSGCMLKACP